MQRSPGDADSVRQVIFHCLISDNCDTLFILGVVIFVVYLNLYIGVFIVF